MTEILILIMDFFHQAKKKTLRKQTCRPHESARSIAWSILKAKTLTGFNLFLKGILVPTNDMKFHHANETHFHTNGSTPGLAFIVR